MMTKDCVLVSGPNITRDEALIGELHKLGEVVVNSINNGIEAILARQEVALIIIEITSSHAFEIEIVRAIRQRYPSAKMILVDGDRDQDLIAQALEYGVNDVFRKPYKRSMIVERTKVMLSPIRQRPP